jgi:CRP-like cAMP-binding protein
MRQIDEGDGEGTWFGDAAKPGSLHNIPMVLSNEAAPTSLFATVPSTVLIIPGLAITSLLKTSPGLALHLARIFLEGLSPV